MQILLYVLIGLFAFDILLGFIDGIIEGKRELKNEYKMSCVLQALDKIMDDRVFPEFKENHENENV